MTVANTESDVLGPIEVLRKSDALSA